MEYPPNNDLVLGDPVVHDVLIHRQDSATRVNVVSRWPELWEVTQRMHPTAEIVAVATALAAAPLLDAVENDIFEVSLSGVQ